MPCKCKPVLLRKRKVELGGSRTLMKPKPGYGLTTTTYRVTKDIIEKLLQARSMYNERKLRLWKIEEYAAKLLAPNSLWFPPTIAIAYCRGKAWRINGQHTLRMLSELLARGYDLSNFFIHVNSYEDVETVSDIALLYAQYDSKLASRVQRDINQSFASLTTELGDIQGKLYDQIVCGLSYAPDRCFTTSPNFNVVEKARLPLDNIDFVTWFAKLAGGKSGKMTRGGVVAAAIEHFNISKVKAKQFWKEMFEPSSVLFQILANSCAGRNTGCKPGMSEKEMFMTCILHWNNWIRDIRNTARTRWTNGDKVPESLSVH